MLKPDEDYEDHADQLVEKYDVESGYWWIELGGDWDDIIGQAEDIRYELYKCVYGVWDHIKNGGDHGAENYELVWVGNVAGTRESRRLMGNYILTENDIIENRYQEDAVAYGGWPMDEHTAAGLWAKGEIPSHVRNFPGLYGIPYGCYCSKNISNMMMTGRIIGASKVAMGSTRVMGTCSVGGQAVGTAAALAVKYGCSPAKIGEEHMKELRQTLLKEDCYIIGCKNEDPGDLALTASLSASSFKEGASPQNVINGITRNAGEAVNMWCSDGIAPDGETLTLQLETAKRVKQIRITFDPDLSKEHCISLARDTIDRIPKGVPAELVKDYTVCLYHAGEQVYKKSVQNNYQRLNILDLPESVTADRAVLQVLTTNGCPDARVFEIRIY